MKNPRRYQTLKILFEAGHIKKFDEIFDQIPVSVLGGDIGIHFTRMKKMKNDPLGFTLNDLVKISSLIEIDPPLLINLAYLKGIETKPQKIKRPKRSKS